jgi:hypothetical protein
MKRLIIMALAAITLGAKAQQVMKFRTVKKL